MNRFHILTLFPKMVMDGLNTSIIGRAIEAGLLEINAVNIRDYSTNKHMKVDDYPYGGGAGLVMQPEPVYRAYKDLEKDMKKKPRVVYLTPQGTTFHQEMAKELAKEEELVFLCGHYEGIDGFGRNSYRLCINRRLCIDWWGIACNGDDRFNFKIGSRCFT